MSPGKEPIRFVRQAQKKIMSKKYTMPLTTKPAIPERKKTVRFPIGVTIKVIVVLVLVVSGIKLFVLFNREEQRHAQRATFAHANKEALMKSACDQIRLVANNVSMLVDAARTNASEVAKLADMMLRKKTKKSESEAGESVEEAEFTAEAGSTNIESTASSRSGERAKPYGIASKEQLEQTAVSGSGKKRTPVQEEKPKSQPRIVILADTTTSVAEDLSQKAQAIQEILQTAVDKKNAAIRSRNLPAIESTISDLSALLATAQKIEQQAKQTLPKAEKALQEAKDLKLKFWISGGDL